MEKHTKHILIGVAATLVGLEILYLVFHKKPAAGPAVGTSTTTTTTNQTIVVGDTPKNTTTGGLAGGLNQPTLHTSQPMDTGQVALPADPNAGNAASLAGLMGYDPNIDTPKTYTRLT